MKTKDLIKYLQKEDEELGGNSNILIDIYNLITEDLKSDTARINDIPNSSIRCTSEGIAEAIQSGVIDVEKEEKHTIFLIAVSK